MVASEVDDEKIEHNCLEFVLQHGAHSDQAMTVAQEAQHLLAGNAWNMDRREISSWKKVEQQLRIASIVLLSACSKLSNAQGISNHQVMSRFLHQPVKPTSVASGLQSNYRWNVKLLIESAHIIGSVIQRSAFNHSIRRVAPAYRLSTHVKVHSEKNSFHQTPPLDPCRTVLASVPTPPVVAPASCHQKPRSCRAQELARSRVQENRRQKKTRHRTQ
jgi:hypothetical protein